MKSRKIYDYITKVAIFSALSFILYMFPKFPLPFFPPFLEIQFSNLPAILGGFVLGPLGGCIIVIARFVIKLPFSHTMYVGELADLLLGLLVVFSSSFIYKYHKNKKGGVVALITSTFVWIISSIFINIFINIPFYKDVYGMEALIGACSTIYKDINADNFMKYYVFFAVIPFNLLLSIVVSFITFFVYKRVSIIFKNDFIKTNENTKKSNKKDPIKLQNKINQNTRLKTLIICDSFKGTLSSKEVAKTIKKNLNPKKYEVDEIIISDGGEGFLDAIENLSTKIDVLEAVDALGRSVKAKYLINDLTNTLFFELAEVVGINKLKQNELDVFHASTYGLGLVIKQAIINHPDTKKIIIGIGGSASNDGGAGMLEAMGVKFFDQEHNIISNLCNEKLQYVNTFDVTGLKELIKDIEFIVLTDVTNPLLGLQGATFVYSPQKGAKESDLDILENNLIHFNKLCTSVFNKDYSIVSGAGAAGGVGFGMVAFCNATLRSGIDTLLEINNFNEIVQTYDLIISGEGCVDEQSFQGKVLSGIIKHQPKRLELVVGFSKLESCEYLIHAVVPEVATMEESLKNPKKCLGDLVAKKF